MKSRTGLEIFMVLRYNLSKFQSIQRGDRSMNEETIETQASWEELHPWLSWLTQQDEDDSIDEVIRYTLDELRFV